MKTQLSIAALSWGFNIDWMIISFLLLSLSLTCRNGQFMQAAPRPAKVDAPQRRKAAMFQTMKMNSGATQGWFRSWVAWNEVRKQATVILPWCWHCFLSKLLSQGTCIMEEAHMRHWDLVKWKWKCKCHIVEMLSELNVSPSFLMRYEIDVDKLLKANVIDA